MFNSLLKSLTEQCNDRLADVEILYDVDNGELSTGNKRNRLIERANGDYIVFVDDDDEVSPDYVAEILQAAKSGADALVFSGWMTTDGDLRRDFHLSIHYPYTAITRNGKIEYLRYPNHITPIKRSIASQFPFENRTIGEDYAWATALHEAGAIKTECKIHKFLYHYKFLTNK
jgi:glycosyltransferase involved in cell wall biosynthesis